MLAKLHCRLVEASAQRSNAQQDLGLLAVEALRADAEVVRVAIEEAGEA